MIFVIPMLVAAVGQAPTALPEVSACRGVAVRAEGGHANLISIIVSGDEASMLRFKAAAEALRNVEVFGPDDVLGERSVTAHFQTTRNDPARSSDGEEALRLFNGAEDGEFGPLQVQPLVMSIDTLPQDRC